ncbi:MAG: hypothetical protein IKK33_18235 [Lachnospiraceae bacterium]|nr:hypothetical protein [Lachnospiraceae bacterium]
MDYRFERPERSHYLSVSGRIKSIEPVGYGSQQAYGCMMLMGVEGEGETYVNFMVTPTTFVLDYVELLVGMNATFYYRADAPAPLIFPPQFSAVVIVPEQEGRFVYVGNFDEELISADVSLQLEMEDTVQVVTTNNQKFLGNPVNKDLVVSYTNSTRSIPAKTTPDKIVVLCQNM